MNEEERKALDRHLKYVGLPTRRDATSPDLYADHDSRFVHNGWLTARAHYRKGVAELVEAVTADEFPIGSPGTWYLTGFNDAKEAIIAKLKDQL